MNHPATFVLSPAASRVLDVLHSEFAVGELCAISQGEIAKIGHVSEGTVSRAMYSLAEHGFIEREWDATMNGGRGGYWIRLLPLPALEGSMIDPSANGSTIDPLADEAKSPTLTPDMAFTASPCGTDQSLIPPAPPMVHDSLSQEEESARAPLFAIEFDPLFQRLVAEPRMNRKLAKRIAKNPLGTVADFNADLRIAQTFAKTPFFFTVGQWRDGQRVIAPEEPRDERPARSVRPDHAPNRPKRPERHPRGDTAPQSHFPPGWGVPAWLTDSGDGGDGSALPAL